MELGNTPVSKTVAIRKGAKVQILLPPHMIETKIVVLHGLVFLQVQVAERRGVLALTLGHVRITVSHAYLQKMWFVVSHQNRRGWEGKKPEKQKVLPIVLSVREKGNRDSR